MPNPRRTRPGVKGKRADLGGAHYMNSNTNYQNSKSESDLLRGETNREYQGRHLLPDLET